MTEFNEYQSTNDYLTGELILAREANNMLTKKNCRLEQLLIKAIKDLEDAGELLDTLSESVNNLTDLVTKQIVKR
jgi:hypothetical protein